MSEPGELQAKGTDKAVWWKAGALLAAVVIGGVLLVGFVGKNPTPDREGLIKSMDRQYNVQLSESDAQCMIDAGYGNAADLAGLSCLRGEQRRYFADLLWRQLASVPASQQAVECFTQWAMSDVVAAHLVEEGSSGRSVKDAQQAAVDYVLADGVRPCATK